MIYIDCQESIYSMEPKRTNISVSKIYIYRKNRQLTDSLEAERDKQETEGNMTEDSKKETTREREQRERRDTFTIQYGI